jgi:hypothetical protein
MPFLFGIIFTMLQSHPLLPASWALEIVTVEERIDRNYDRRTRTVLRVKCDKRKKKIDECS